MMMLAKIAALGLFKIKEFWNKGYGVIFFSMTSPTEFMTCSTYIVDAVMWLKIDSSSTSMWEVIITSIF